MAKIQSIIVTTESGGRYKVVRSGPSWVTSEEKSGRWFVVARSGALDAAMRAVEKLDSETPRDTGAGSR